MTIRTDFLFINNQSVPIAAVEVKARHNLADNSANEMARILASDLPDTILFLMLVTSDTGYLWKDPVRASNIEQSVQKFSMKEVFGRYLVTTDATRMRERQLTLVVAQWLHDLVNDESATDSPPEDILRLSGFLRAIHDASILEEGIYDRIR